jgi:hypothetical protein
VVNQWSVEGGHQRTVSSVSLIDDSTGNKTLWNLNKKTASQPDLCAHNVSTKCNVAVSCENLVSRFAIYYYYI